MHEDLGLVDHPVKAKDSLHSDVVWKHMRMRYLGFCSDMLYTDIVIPFGQRKGVRYGEPISVYFEVC